MRSFKSTAESAKVKESPRARGQNRTRSKNTATATDTNPAATSPHYNMQSRCAAAAAAALHRICATPCPWEEALRRPALSPGESRRRRRPGKKKTTLRGDDRLVSWQGRPCPWGERRRRHWPSCSERFFWCRSSWTTSRKRLCRRRSAGGGCWPQALEGRGLWRISRLMTPSRTAREGCPTVLILSTTGTSFYRLLHWKLNFGVSVGPFFFHLEFCHFIQKSTCCLCTNAQVSWN